VGLYGSSKPIKCSKELSYRVIDEIQVDRPVRKPRLKVLNRERKMPEPQLRIGVVGLGLLGRGIAACFIAHGFRVVGFTRPAAGFKSARQYIESALHELIAHRVALPIVATEWQNYYSEAESLAEFSDCDFVIESIFEDFEAKSALFRELELVIGPSVPLATNTSALPITSLQKHLTHPNRFIGMHWAEPCHVTRFLEIIRGEQTDDATADAVMHLARSLRKDPALVRKDINGFIVNRIGYAMYREAFYLLENGIADIETIDRAFRNVIGLWGTVVGPFRWMDLTGLKGYAAAMEKMLPTLSTDRNVPELLRDLVTKGHNGVFTGRGFYEYTPQEAEFWQKLYHDQVWAITQFHERHFPIEASAEMFPPDKTLR
jgi:3-hydroxybutyryl-CoA dehydrogenase